MVFMVRGPGFMLCAGAAIAFAACGGGSTEPPPNGSVSVSVTLHGGGSDSDGFAVTVGTHNVVIQPGTPLTVSDVSPATYSVHLGGLAPQCSTAADTATVVVQSSQTVAAHFTVTCYGGIAFNEATGGGQNVFYLDTAGRIRPLTSGSSRSLVEDWSPDGTRVVFGSDRNGNQDLYVVRTDGTQLTRLTSDTADDLLPRWSPDGTTIVFYRVPHSGAFTYAQLHLVNPDGTNERPLLDNTMHDFDPTWTPDGKTIVFSCDRFGLQANLCAVSPADTGLRGIIFSAGAQHLAASPDGSRVGFQSFDGGQQIWVATLDGQSAVNLTPGLTSFDFGWSPDGSHLAVATYDGQHYQIQLVSRSASGLTPLTIATDEAGDGRWSLDGARIVFYSLRTVFQELWIMNADGSNQHAITSGGGPKFHPLWNPLAKPGS